MFHKLTLTAVVLAAGALMPHGWIDGVGLTAQEPIPVPRTQRFWVQIRQPNWQEQQFFSRQDLDYFIRTQRQNGWEVQVANLPDGTFSARYRLLKWGGSQIVDTLGDARRWAAELQEQGYETRIVNYP
jgi:hypothetical protein